MQPSGRCKTQGRSSVGSRSIKKDSQVRLTDIKSVFRFTDQFNRSEPINRRFLESEARDILDRLARLSLQSSILDPVRVDPIRQSLKAVRKTMTSDLVAQDKTRFYAAEARISLVAFGSCQALHLRDRALDILLEALETNILSFDASESRCLFDLITHLTKALQSAIDSARTVNPAEMRVNVDSHMERLVKALMLCIQRIDYFVDMEALVLSPEHSDSLHDVCRELDMFKTDDPHIVYMILSLHEAIKWILFRANNVDSYDEAATLRIALSYGSHVIRMEAPTNSDQLQGAFESILEDLSSKLYLGKKFINFLGTAAMYHIDACKLFMGVLKHLRSLHWQWMYQALLILGSIVLCGESSQIRKIALEDGLLIYLSFGDDADQSSHKYTWTSRAGCVIALNHIFTQRKESSIGILAQSALNARKMKETHPIVLKLLKMGGSNVNRLSAIFKYIGRALAEDYTESQDKLADLKTSLKSSRTLVKSPHKRNPVKKLDILNPDLKNLKLSVDPYHKNYKKHPTLLDQQKLIDSQLKISTKPSSLGNSYSSYTSNADHIKTQITIPTAGTANRRKLFNPEIDSEDGDEEYNDVKIGISEYDSKSSSSLHNALLVMPALTY